PARSPPTWAARVSAARWRGSSWAGWRPWASRTASACWSAPRSDRSGAHPSPRGAGAGARARSVARGALIVRGTLIVRGALIVRRALIVRGAPQEVGEGVQVAGRLPAGHPPGVLLADRGGEAQFQQGVEAAVCGLQDLTQQPVQFLRRDGGQRQTAGDVDVAERVDRVGDPVQLEVAFQQPAVDARLVPGELGRAA